jgi:hypothetical protein
MKVERERMANTKKVTYDELAYRDIGDMKQIVVSSRSSGGFTVGQRYIIPVDDGSKEQLFIKGGIHLSNFNAVKQLYDALGETIQKFEGETDDGVKWDKW